MAQDPADKGRGAGIIPGLWKEVTKRRIPILMESPLTAIIRETPADGAVQGVQCRGDLSGPGPGGQGDPPSLRRLGSGGGVHGRNRVGGNATAECLVFGREAGIRANAEDRR